MEKKGGDIKTQRLDTCGRVLEVKWMKTVFADVKLWVLGSSTLPANCPLEQDERCNVSINCKDGRAFFLPSIYIQRTTASLASPHLKGPFQQIASFKKRGRRRENKTGTKRWEKEILS